MFYTLQLAMLHLLSQEILRSAGMQLSAKANFWIRANTVPAAGVRKKNFLPNLFQKIFNKIIFIKKIFK